MTRRSKSDHELKWNPSHEQPLTSPLIYSILGGPRALAQTWPICPLPLGIWTGLESDVFISFFLMVSGIKDRARCVHMCAKVCDPKGEEQLSIEKLCF